MLEPSGRRCLSSRPCPDRGFESRCERFAVFWSSLPWRRGSPPSCGCRSWPRRPVGCEYSNKAFELRVCSDARVANVTPLLPGRVAGGSCTPGLWVPGIRSPHATCPYSWISPPSRSRRMTLSAGTVTAGSPGPSGGACPKARYRGRSTRCGGDHIRATPGLTRRTGAMPGSPPPHPPTSGTCNPASRRQAGASKRAESRDSTLARAGLVGSPPRTGNLGPPPPTPTTANRNLKPPWPRAQVAAALGQLTSSSAYMPAA